MPRDKWRPPLSLVVGAVMVAVLVLPFVFMVFAELEPGRPRISFDILLPTLGISMVFASIVGFIFVRALTGPVRELTSRTKRLSAGDRGALGPMKQHGNREFAALSAGLFGMASALFQRSDYISNFARHVSHEIKTPLTSLRGAAELMLDQGDDMTRADRQRFVENMLDDTWRITALLDRLRELAHADNPQDRGETTLRNVGLALCERFPALSVDLDGAIDACLPMTDENAVIVFSNLLENALQHGATEVGITASMQGSELSVDVRDNGTGISAGNKTQIFELFFTTRRSSGGTGMGLGIARSMMVAHGGRIDLRPSKSTSALGCGAIFNLRIPLSQG